MFLEILKIIGGAALTAAVTIYAMHVKRIWEKEDRSVAAKKQENEKFEALAEEVKALTGEFKTLNKKVDKLSQDLETEMSSTKKENEGLQAGLREILYDRIKFLCRKYMADGEIREEDYKSLQRMWGVYHTELGGNGFLNDAMEEIDTLKKY